MKITRNIYRPWNPLLTERTLNDSWEGEFSVLDIQLGSACNAHCGHCDSSCSSCHEPADIDVGEIVRLLKEMRASHDFFSPDRQTEPLWCFVCGLGEPTEPTENLPKLLELLDRTEEIGVNFALFNNGLYWDEKLNKHLGGGRAYRFKSKPCPTMSGESLASWGLARMKPVCNYNTVSRCTTLLVA